MTAAPIADDRRWLFGPVPDLLVGCGVLYGVLFVAQAAAGDAMRTLLPLTLLPFLTLLLGAPHYGATLLRVVERAEGRERYVRFTIALSVVCALLFVLSLHDFVLGSLIVTLYITWSPWHYSGQNYGVGLVFLRRRGIAVPPLARQLLQGSFVLSFLLTVLALHGADPSGEYAPVNYRGTAYQLIPLNLPRALVEPLFLATAVSFAACSVGAAVLLLRRAGPRDLLPTALVWATQTLWFVAPSVVRHWALLPGIDPLAPGNAAYTLMWVAMGHFLQYLWFTSWLAVGRAPLAARFGYFGKSLLAGAALWVLPTLVFAPGLLGRVPYDFGLAVMGAALVNVHHFVLDGLIWKTSSGSRLRRLLADPPRDPAAASRRPPRWATSLVWATGAACVVISFVGYWEGHFGFREAAERQDLARYRAAVARAGWIGRASPRHHLLMARMALEQGDLEDAKRELARSVELYPTPEAVSSLAELYERTREWGPAADAWQQLVEMEGEDATRLYRIGVLRLRLGEHERARDVLRRAAELAPEDGAIRASLERAEKALRDPGIASAGAVRVE